MNDRLIVFVVALAVGLGMVGYGFLGSSARVYDKPAPEDDPSELHEKNSKLVGEVRLGHWIARERVQLDDRGRLIDYEVEAPCYS